VLDLVPFAYALRLGTRGRGARPRLLAPPGARDALRGLGGTWGSPELLEAAFALEEYEEGEGPSVGGLGLAFREVPHYVRTFAVRVEEGDRRLVYGADCGPNAALVELARGAELLVAEATLPAPEDEQPRGHLTAREAGEHGRAAGVARLVLTHFSDELDALRVRAEGTAGFGAPVELAREGATYALEA
jgi:ribonuclease BN (tRNA processing enzyme)